MEAKCEEIIERALTYWACKQRRNVVIPGARTSLNIQWADTLKSIPWGESVSKAAIAEEVEVRKSDDTTGVEGRILTGTAVDPQEAQRAARQKRVQATIRKAADTSRDEDDVDPDPDDPSAVPLQMGRRQRFRALAFDERYGPGMNQLSGQCPFREAIVE